MKIDFWVDPGCPFCWTTARWVVDEVQPHRDIDVTWRPISLLLKNEPERGTGWHEAAAFTHGLLRVMESVRTTDGNDGVFKLYWEFGSRIHHDKESPFDPADALATLRIHQVLLRGKGCPIGASYRPSRSEFDAINRRKSRRQCFSH